MLTAPHDFRGLFEGRRLGFPVGVKIGFRLGLEGLVRVRGWITPYVDESPHKVISTRVCVCLRERDNERANKDELRSLYSKMYWCISNLLSIDN